MPKAEMDDGNFELVANLESSGSVPYGSTYVELPNEWNFAWNGSLTVTIPEVLHTAAEDGVEELLAVTNEAVDMLKTWRRHISDCEVVYIREFSLLSIKWDKDKKQWQFAFEVEDLGIY